MKKSLCLLALCMSLLTLSGCKKNKEVICTTVYPIQYLVERIGQPYVDVCNITSDEVIQTASIKKNFEEELKDANAFFYISGMEPYFDIYIDDIRDSKANYIDLSSKVFFYPFARYTQSVVDGKSEVVSQPYYTGDVFNNVNTYTYDPFIWMDPMIMISVAELIRDYIIDLYPEHEEQIRENYKEVESDLTILDSNYQLLKNTNTKISFVSMTPSFGNWQTSFHLEVYPVILSKYGALPNEEQLQIIKQKITDDGVTHIAHEKNLSEDMEALYQQLVEEMGLIPIELSNISSINKNGSNNHRDYLTIMYDNLKVLESIGN